MGRLLSVNLTSLDGYIADREGGFDWAAPDEEVHAAVNDLVRPVGTYLYGRRMYEVMRVWETFGTDAEEPAVIRDFGALWRAAEKVVYSGTLTEASTARTRLEREFSPAVVRALKERTTAPLAIGGPHLAASAFSAGLVDEVHVFVAPVSVGGGTAALPGSRVDLELMEERRIGRFVHLAYRVV